MLFEKFSTAFAIQENTETWYCDSQYNCLNCSSLQFFQIIKKLKILTENAFAFEAVPGEQFNAL